MVFGYIRLRSNAPLGVKIFLIVHAVMLPLAFGAMHLAFQAHLSKNFPDIPLGALQQIHTLI